MGRRSGPVTVTWTGCAELAASCRPAGGAQPLGYGGKWFLDPMTAPRQAELVAAFESIIIPAYPHQPSKVAQEQWPRPPVETAAWEGWACTTQGGDPGLPNGPTLPTGVHELEAWQFSSMGDTAHYGWASSHHLDLNVVTVEAWNTWTATAPPPPPEYLYPVGYGTSLVTEAEMRRRYEPHMEPEFARRFFPGCVPGRARLAAAVGAAPCSRRSQGLPHPA